MYEHMSRTTVGNQRGLDSKRPNSSDSYVVFRGTMILQSGLNITYTHSTISLNLCTWWSKYLTFAKSGGSLFLASKPKSRHPCLLKSDHDGRLVNFGSRT